MKTSDLIAALQKNLETVGDLDIAIDVRDFFTKYGREASINLDTSGVIWSGIGNNTDLGITWLTVHLKDNEDGKHPKIMFLNGR